MNNCPYPGQRIAARLFSRWQFIRVLSFVTAVGLGPIAILNGEPGSTVGANASESGFSWEMASPESQGLSSAKLDVFKDGLASRNTQALLIVRNDRIVYEWYADGKSQKSRLGTASTAKALVGGVAAAVEITDGLIHLDDPASKFIPEWLGDPVKSKITIRELGSHTSGLDDAEAIQPFSAADRANGIIPASIAHEKLTGWKGDFWKRLPVPNDPFTISRDLVPTVYAPGERFSYSNPGIAMLGYTLTAALKGAPLRDIHSLIHDRVMRKIGIPDGDWEIGYNQTFKVGGLDLVPIWGGGSYTARATARIARLMLRNGDWDGQRILTPEAVVAVTLGANSEGPSQVAIGWWNNQRGTIPGLPRDVYFAQGAGHRLVVVIPSLQTIIVRNGELLSTSEPFMPALNEYFFEPLVRALENTRAEIGP